MTPDALLFLAHLARAESHGESTVIVPGSRGGIAAGALVDAGLACVGGSTALGARFVRVTMAGMGAAGGQGMYFTPPHILDPAAGSGSFLADVIGNPPFGDGK